MDGRPLDTRIAAVAASQHGLVTAAQAAAAGCTPRMAQWRVRTGRWVRVLPGVFAIAGAGPDPTRDLLAACLYVGGGSVASHRSAAWLWRLSGFDVAPPPEVTVQGDTGRRRPGLRVHRTDRLDRRDVSRLGVVPVTRIERTLLDLASVVDEAVVELARDDAIRRGLLVPWREAERLRALGGPGRRGSGVLRAIHERERGLAVPGSELERPILDALARRGVPAPVRQHRVVLPSGRHIDIDIAWPSARVALEVQGYAFHSGRRRWLADIARSNAATSLRWHLVQATKEDERDGCRRLAADLLRLLDGAAA